MKKIYASVLACLAIAGAVNAQSISDVRALDVPENAVFTNVKRAEVNFKRGAADTVWSTPIIASEWTVVEDTASPANFQVDSLSNIPVVPNLRPVLGDGNPWVSPTNDGTVIGINMFSGTVGGYDAADPSTQYNDVNALVTLNDPIEISSNGLALTFHQTYVPFNGDQTFVTVSTDGTTWTDIEVNAGVAGNTYAPEDVFVDLSVAIPDGSTQLYLGFKVFAPNREPDYQFGGGYGWAVDDIAITDVPANNITMARGFYQDPAAKVDYRVFPLSQIPAEGLRVGADVVNDGSASQDVTLTVEVTHPTGGTFTLTSDPVTLEPKGETTIELFLSSSEVDQEGDYTIDLAVGNGEVDASPSNNLSSQVFTIGAERISHAPMTWDRGLTSNAAFYQDDQGNYYAYKMISTYFPYTSNDTIYGISFLVDTLTVPDVETIISFNKFDNPTSGSYDAATEIALADVIITEDLIGSAANPSSSKYITVEFEEPILFDASEAYFVSIECYGGVDFIRPAISGGNSDNANVIYGPFGADEAVNYYGFTGVEYHINLHTDINFASTINGISSKQLEVEGFVTYPNPSNDVLNVAFGTKEAFEANVTLKDITGKAVMTQSISAVQGMNKTSVNTAEYAEGIYFLTLEKGTETITKKVVITH